MRKIFRVVALSLHILLGVVLTFLLASIFRKDWHHPSYRRATRWWLAHVCTLLGVKVHVTGEIETPPVMYVSNHISWLDIPLLASLTNPRFLSKQEVRHWPIIGWLADKSGTLFISRGQNGASNSASARLTESLKHHHSVLIFPEGTTSMGHDVRRFHGRLLGAAIETQSLVQPVAIKYIDEEGNHDVVTPFVDKQTLVQNLWKLLGRKHTIAEVHFLSPVTSKNKQRNELALICEEAIRKQIITE